MSISSTEEIDKSWKTTNATFRTGLTRDLAWRRWQLKQLWWLIDDNSDRMAECLKEDLNRPRFEAFFSDIEAVKKDIIEHLKHLDEWTATKPIDAGFLLGRMGKARLRKEPLGTTLIIGAWNFPFQLTIGPMIAAIAAGCCVMLKPSELAGSCEQFLVENVPKYLDQRAIRTITGGPKEMSYILEKRYDHIFFTGSSKIARFITAAAAKHLTPTVLELGGQGPCIVAKTADIDLAARRIAWAKHFNAGQICLSVNNVFCEPEIASELAERLDYWNTQFLLQGDSEMSHIINERNFDRLTELLDGTKGTISSGGKRDRAQKFIEPTVVTDVTMQDSLMSEELFGPILPIITATVEEALAFINDMPASLGLYIFTKDPAQAEDVLDRTTSGGVTINNTLFHAALDNAPFGGVGESGYGSYHGSYGIEAFSHHRPVVEPPSWFDKLISFTYPPYDMKNIKWVVAKNTLGFKRGETMEDQRNLRSGLFGGAFTVAGVVGVAGVAATLWLAPDRLRSVGKGFLS